MLYAIICEDSPESLSKRMSVRSAHLQRLSALQDQGRLVLAGPHPAIEAENPGEAGFTGLTGKRPVRPAKLGCSM